MIKKKLEQLNKSRNEIIIYQSKGGDIRLRIKFKQETIWLNAHQMAQIFGVNRPAIVKHISNIYKTKELNKKSTCSILEQVAADGKIRRMNLYNLDIIISVGYRVNSRKATQFRIWSTKILKSYLLRGYAVNQEKLLETKSQFNKLQKTISFLKNKSKKQSLKGQEKGILDLLADYSRTLTLLEQYDKNKIKQFKGKKSKFILQYKDCLNIIYQLKKELVIKKQAGNIFGNEVEHKFEGVVKNLYQTFDKKELYISLEEKAANFIYLTIKDHPFTDGNKRIGSFLFVYFLDKSNFLYRSTGEKKINDNTLTALALLVAESKPKEKTQIIALITQLLK